MNLTADPRDPEEILSYPLETQNPDIRLVYEFIKAKGGSPSERITQGQINPI